MRRRIESFDRTQRRKTRIRAKMKALQGDKIRVVVYRSCKYTYAQALDREGKVVASFSSLVLRRKNGKKGTKLQEALEVGKQLGSQLKKKKIAEVIFDRGAYKYHGRVKNIAQGLREAGIKV